VDHVVVERHASSLAPEAELKPVGSVHAAEELITRHLVATTAYQRALDQGVSRRHRMMASVAALLILAGIAVAFFALRGDGALSAERGRAADIAPNKITLSDGRTFFVDRHEVTNGQYQSCVRTGSCVGPQAPERAVEEPANSRYPVTGVLPREAEKFCLFARGKGWGLPTFRQYLVMAEQDESGEYPHGNVDDVTPAAAIEELKSEITTVDVASLSSGNLGSVIGNIAEWTRTACAVKCQDIATISESTTKSLRAYGLSYNVLADGDPIDGSWLTMDNSPDLVFNSDKGLYFVGFRCATPTM
jgi:formylglycine-generating enzyme required for sulfatase activity